MVWSPSRSPTVAGVGPQLSVSTRILTGSFCWAPVIEQQRATFCRAWDARDWAAFVAPNLTSPEPLSYPPDHESSSRIWLRYHCRTMADRDLTFTPATELVRLYRARRTSPLGVVQALLSSSSDIARG
jgi:hypothetical protein